MLMDEAGDGSGGGGGEQGAEGGAGGVQGQEGGAGGGQQQAGSGNPQYVPYERFQEVNTKFRDIEGKYGQLQQTIDQLRGALSPEQKKGFKLDYSNPEKSMQEYFDKLLEEKIGGLKKEGTEREQMAQRQSAVKWFKDTEEYTPELEEKAAKFITENNLQSLNPMVAIKLAHKFVTMGEGSGYTRSVKEGLRKPGLGGKAKDKDARAELEALDPKDEKYEEKMKAIHGKLVGG
jgi:hypothetical protein